MKLIYFVIAGLVGGIFFPCSAIANELTLREAFEMTLQGNPSLQKYPYQQRMVEADKLQAALRPNPAIEFELENVAGSGNSQGLEHAEATLSFSQLIELGGKREQRVELASAQASQLEAEFGYAKIEVLAETARRFYDVVRLQSLAKWNSQQRERLEKAQKTAQQRVDSGAVPPSEVTRVLLQQRQVVARSQELTGQLKEASAHLSAMWAGEPEFTGVIGKFQAAIEIPSQTDVERAVNQAPEFLRLLDSERLLSAKAESIKASASADLSLGLGVRFNNQSNDTSLVLQASMPLQLSNPSQGSIQANKTERELNIEQQRLVRQQLQVYASALLARIQTNFRYAKTIQSDLLPLAEQLEQETKEGYAKGINSLLVILDAQHELAQLEYQLIERRSAIYHDILELERMTGQSFLESKL